MIYIIRNCFSFKKIFKLKNYSFKKFVLFFILLVLVISFPLNYQIILNDGFKGLTSVTYKLQTTKIDDWFPSKLPSDMYITRSGLNYLNDSEYTFTTLIDGEEFTLIINNKTNEFKNNTIVLGKEKITYIDKFGNELIGDYNNVIQTVDFSDLKSMDKNEAKAIFFNMIDSSFNKYGVFYSLSVNTIIQFIMNTLLVIICAAIMLLVRINYKKVTTFSENVKIIIASMTIPGLISFVVGLLGLIELNSFTVVIFQFLTPIIALLAIYKGSNEKVASTKGL